MDRRVFLKNVVRLLILLLPWQPFSYLSSIMVSIVTEKSLLTKWQFVFLIGCAVSSEAWQGSQLESAPESHPKQCFAFSDLIALLPLQSRHVSAVSSFPPLFQKYNLLLPALV